MNVTESSDGMMTTVCVWNRPVGAILVLFSALATPIRTGLAQEARVVVNRDELRVEFPLDTTSRYAWPHPGGRYTWTMSVDAIDWPRTFVLTATEPQPREFPSLEAVVATAIPLVCEAHPAGGNCSSRRGDTAYVARGRVVLRMQDSATIVRMFGGRPAAARLTVELPGLAGRNADVMVLVTYGSPDVPKPNADLIAEIQHTKGMYSGPKNRTSIRPVP